MRSRRVLNTDTLSFDSDNIEVWLGVSFKISEILTLNGNVL